MPRVHHPPTGSSGGRYHGNDALNGLTGDHHGLSNFLLTLTLRTFTPSGGEKRDGLAGVAASSVYSLILHVTGLRVHVAVRL